MADPETQQFLLAKLKEHLSSRLCQPQQTLASRAPGERPSTPRCGIEPADHTDLIERSLRAPIAAEPESEVSSEGKYICGICWKRFDGQANRNRHEKRHGEDRRHWCTESDCDKTFSSKYGVTRHSKLVRGVDSPLVHYTNPFPRFTRRKHFLASAVINNLTDMMI
jgi:hypothetical protein